MVHVISWEKHQVVKSPSDNTCRILMSGFGGKWSIDLISALSEITLTWHCITSKLELNLLKLFFLLHCLNKWRQLLLLESLLCADSRIKMNTWYTVKVKHNQVFIITKCYVTLFRDWSPFFLYSAPLFDVDWWRGSEALNLCGNKKKKKQSTALRVQMDKVDKCCSNPQVRRRFRHALKQT